MSRQHPATWWTTTLLAEHGPTNRSDYDVMVALASWRADQRVVTRSVPDLARRARMTAKATKAAVRRLEREGWLHVVRPLATGRGHANGYVINRDPLVAAACEATGWPLSDPEERGSETTPFDPSTDPTERGSETTPFSGERGSKSSLKGVEKTPPVVKGVQGRGVRGAATAARTSPAAGVTPTAPPLPDPTGKPQRPTDPTRTCHDHDTWKGDHLCHACRVDRLASEAHTDAMDTYRSELAAWEATRCVHGNAADGCPECAMDAELAEAAHARQLAAEASLDADAANMPQCPHGVIGGDTADAHGNTAAECPECETPLLIAHAVAGCDDDTCPANPMANRLAVKAAANARDLVRRDTAERINRHRRRATG